ncbi:MAG: L,D-transpeptidase [Desulfomonilaceae bacterium]
MSLRPANRWVFIALFLILFVLPIARAHSSENLVAERVLGFANPNDWGSQEQVARLAAVPRHELEKLDELLAVPPRSGRKVAYSFARQTFYDDLLGNTGDRATRRFYPGSSSLVRIQRDLVKVASLPGNDFTVVTKQGGQVLDDASGLNRLGRLVGDPRPLYATYEILVDRSKYTVQLFGVKEDDTRTLLFECRAGLGSVEYPTPKGTYYIVRIFDDKPLWIPPPDREWAWGQSPSRTVYGGHMMPLFSKQIPTKEVSTSQTGGALDFIAPPVKMVDSGAYRVHGTDSPWSVGSNQSHGCIRLLNSSVAQLADTLKLYVGTTTRGETANGPYVNLARPVRLILF